NGLSTLLDVEGVDAVFGADIVFEMKALFCSAFGPNLRNAFAHGLMDDDDFYSADAVYAWWFMLRWVALVYWAQSASNHQTIKPSSRCRGSTLYGRRRAGSDWRT
ncbi:DUF4209 domain-containing protein, partial [Pseudomonas viridiflava]